MLLGSLFWGTVMDRYGRKKVSSTLLCDGRSKLVDLSFGVRYPYEIVAVGAGSVCGLCSRFCFGIDQCICTKLCIIVGIQKYCWVWSCWFSSRVSLGLKV